MADRDLVFLSPEEALGAIRSDFTQYPPQTRLFLDLYTQVLGPGWTVIEDARNEDLWITSPSRRKRNMRRISVRDFGELLLNALNSQKPELPKLAGLCELIFQTRAYPGTNGSGHCKGIWIESGMQAFQCRQCGRCCMNLDYRFELTHADYELWHQLGRGDILEWVAAFRRNGEIVSYAIWVYPGTRQYAPVCPWLEKIPGSAMWRCRIHDVKPEACRQYPASRKHARMTGCPAFS